MSRQASTTVPTATATMTNSQTELESRCVPSVSAGTPVSVCCRETTWVSAASSGSPQRAQNSHVVLFCAWQAGQMMAFATL